MRWRRFARAQSGAQPRKLARLRAVDPSISRRSPSLRSRRCEATQSRSRDAQELWQSPPDDLVLAGHFSSVTKIHGDGEWAAAKEPFANTGYGGPAWSAALPTRRGFPAPRPIRRLMKRQ